MNTPMFYLVSPIQCVLLGADCKSHIVVSPTLNVTLTLFFVPCKQIHNVAFYKWNSSKFQSSTTRFHDINVRIEVMPNIVSIVGHLDEPKILWNDNTCKLTHKKCH